MIVTIIEAKGDILKLITDNGIAEEYTNDEINLRYNITEQGAFELHELIRHNVRQYNFKLLDGSTKFNEITLKYESNI